MKWYEKTWATILFLIFFFPVGLYLMWRYMKWNKVVKGIITGFFALCVLVNIATGGANSGTATTANKETTKQEETANKTEDKAEKKDEAKEKSLEEATKQEEKKIEQTKTVEEKKDDVPTEYKSALKKAQVYADNMYMSKAGLYDQLTSEYGERFPAEAAQYAIDNVQADWKNNALKKAETYQNDMAMSKQAVYDQLVSDYGEKFTAEEAQYAIDNLK